MIPIPFIEQEFPMDNASGSNQKKSPILTFLCIAVAFIILSASLFPSVNSSAKNGTVTKLTEGWVRVLPDGTRVPFDSFGKEVSNGFVTIAHDTDTLPPGIDSIGFYNYYCAVTLCADNRRIYNYGTVSNFDNCVLLGNYYSMVHIAGDIRDAKELQLIFYNREPLTIYPVCVGTGSALEMAMIREYLPSLILPIITLFFVIVTVILSKRKMTHDLITEKYIWILVFSVCLSIWGIADSQLLMDLGAAAGSVCMISFEVYMLLPIPLLMFMYHSCTKGRQADLYLCYLVIANFTVLNLLNFTGVASFLRSLASTHILTACAMLFSLYQTLEEHDSRRQTGSFYLLFGFSCFFLCALVQYINFFSDPSGTNSNIMLVGAVFFVAFQIAGIFRESNERIRLVTKKLENQNELLTKAFGSFIPDEIVQSIVDSPEKVKVGGGTRELTVLSSDIRGFTELIRPMTAEDVIGMLNHYLESMTCIIDRHRGVIMEFVGDGILATFVSDDKGNDHADRAIFAAIDMQNYMQDINAWNLKHGYPEFEMGIGINTGPAFIGYIGSSARIKYDAIGSTINFGARVESYSTGGQILITESTRNASKVNLEISDTYHVLPKGAAQEVALSVVAGIGDPYNYMCVSSADTPVTLEKIVEVQYKLIEEKHCSADVYSGHITALSEKFATILTAVPLKLFDNIRIVTPSLISAKVVSRSKNGYLIRFTSAHEFRSELDRSIKKENSSL